MVPLMQEIKEESCGDKRRNKSKIILSFEGIVSRQITTPFTKMRKNGGESD